MVACFISFLYCHVVVRLSLARLLSLLCHCSYLHLLLHMQSSLISLLVICLPVDCRSLLHFYITHLPLLIVLFILYMHIISQWPNITSFPLPSSHILLCSFLS